LVVRLTSWRSGADTELTVNDTLYDREVITGSLESSLSIRTVTPGSGDNLVGDSLLARTRRDRRLRITGSDLTIYDSLYLIVVVASRLDTSFTVGTIAPRTGEYLVSDYVCRLARSGRVTDLTVYDSLDSVVVISGGYETVAALRVISPGSG
jgi:hypothetical protein